MARIAVGPLFIEPLTHRFSVKPKLFSRYTFPTGALRPLLEHQLQGVFSLYLKLYY